MGNQGPLRVELDRLAGLGPTLHDLANQAASLRTGPSAGPYLSVPGGMEPAVLEASSIASDLVDTAMVTAVKNRLSETGDLMVDVDATNAKLRARARRTVAFATGAPEADVDAAIAAAQGEVKVAIVALIGGLDAAAARARLEAAGGVVRRALENGTPA